MKFLIVLLLAGCSLTTDINLKCSGQCELDAGRTATLEKP